MATLKVKFRKSTVEGKAGVVYYQICHRCSSRQLSARIKVLPQYWDDNGKKFISDSGNMNFLQKCQRQIESDVKLLEDIIRELDSRGEEYTVSSIISMFRSCRGCINVLSFLKEQTDVLRSHGKYGTARNYQRTFNSFSAFLTGKDISFTLFDESLIERYSEWLKKRNIVKNSISFYMRVLRSVYNKAVRQRITQQRFPFVHVYTGVDRTRKRAVSEDIIVRMQNLELSFSPSLALARDLFVFSFCTRGMAFVDIAFLKKDNIKNGTIYYMRHKSGKRLAIRIEPCIEDIIKRYEKDTVGSPYVFPVISADSPEDVFRQYQTALGYYNRKLKRLGVMVGEETGITSYVARHTWATTARNLNVPISVISAGMGHSSEKMTQIYLASLEESVIDQANKKILDLLGSRVSK